MINNSTRSPLRLQVSNEIACIETLKVYDFCFQSDTIENACVTIPAVCITPVPADVEVLCAIASVNTTIVSRVPLPPPAPAGFARVTIRLVFTTTFTLLNPDGSVRCTFSADLAFVKTVGLCAPIGTEVVVEVTTSRCGPCFILGGTQICCEIDFCMLIQSESLVKILVPVVVRTETALGAQQTVSLGTASTFGILAGSTITNTGPTLITGTAGGDVGLWPGSSFTGQGSATITGSVHLADAVAMMAQSDLTIAYNDAAGRTPVTTIPTELGGTTVIPGVYDSAAGTFEITGTLTLDAQGDPNAVFIFKAASTLVTASGSNVVFINGARACMVFWQVGSSATLGTNSHFAGHILALTSITATTGATVEGQLLARNGAVTLDTNTIVNTACPVIPTPSPVPSECVELPKTALACPQSVLFPTQCLPISP